MWYAILYMLSKKEGQPNGQNCLEIKKTKEKKINTCNTAFSIQDGTINGLCDPIFNLA